MLELVDDKERIDPIISVSKDVRSYLQFRTIKNLGITIGLNDISFEKAMLFSWIEENLNVGKTGI